jgi:uncharacterized protein
MDFFYLYRGQTFCWNMQKEAENFVKHGVHFQTACEVFFDQLSAFVDASIAEEARLALIGLGTDRKLLYVVHVVRATEMLRIISAREATAQERRIYEDGE